MSRPLKVALAHDWLNGMRGGERCLDLIGREYPAAELYTLLYQPEQVSEAIRRRTVHVSGLQRVPGFRRHYRWFLPLFPMAMESFRLPAGTDLVISTSHCVAKGIRPPPGAKHLCYCFTPMRYAWALQEDYFGRGGLKRALIDRLLARLRRWDVAANERVDRFVAISRHVQKRIETFYGREAAVVYPPVATQFFTPGEAVGSGGYDLIVSALVPYKRVDLAVRAYAQLGTPLKIAGVGTEWDALRASAPPNVEFLGRVPDEGIRELYRGCRFLIFPGEEDFGIVPLEAQACGKPVVALGRGGLLETVVAGTTGVFFAEQTPEALAAAVRDAAQREWQPATIRAHAEQFSEARFLDGLRAEINKLLAGRG
ncbi:MAG TPA: glycosyltransferase [Kiritimatiellia bacterium]|nr:glycosyltransferase [Kiritimatiellia bacterium]OQC59201.1 MAG: D-inositol 3-phosphate glycosyltransferase [Verrucomicrobia bacterium ADurb.Bin018]HQF20830.1 glycosyltransferase [Kiritimatiellia bacterium]HQG74854.1 glycosyltransferase [Kiritimatiellia bacterium]